MRLVIIIILILLISPTTYCAEEKSSSSYWGENTEVFNKGFENQKPVSDSKLQKTIEMLKERNKTKKEKKFKSQITPITHGYDEEHLKDFVQSQDPDNELSQTLTVMIPMRAYSDDGIYINPGYYKLSCHKIANNEYVLELSQGTTRILTVKAEQTQEDLKQESISFCNAEIIDNGRIRLMYGSIDLNLVGYLYFDE